MAELVIFGAGDIARLAHFYFSRDSPHKVAGFAVDEEYREGEQFDGLPLVSAARLLDEFPPDRYQAFVALSYARMNRLRAEKYRWMLEQGYACVSYVSSRCSLLTEHPIGANCFILEDNTIQPYCRIGNDVTLWSGNHIGHDSVIEDHCFISSHVVVSGWVRVRSYSFLGVNSTLRDNITIGESCLIGAGAVVLGDTDNHGVYVPERAHKLDMDSHAIGM
ncbi:MAG TPA: acetyltransferase [Thermoanaerobaculia bacterium]|nr:acetyltransferase [Thermoanaerobaculia bacterium]